MQKTLSGIGIVIGTIGLFASLFEASIYWNHESLLGPFSYIFFIIASLAALVGSIIHLRKTKNQNDALATNKSNRFRDNFLIIGTLIMIMFVGILAYIFYSLSIAFPTSHSF